MALRVYAEAAAPEPERNARMLGRWFVATGAEVINSREIARSARIPDLRKSKAVDEAIDFLVEANWLRSSGVPNSGRTRKDFLVNPKVREIEDGSH